MGIAVVPVGPVGEVCRPKSHPRQAPTRMGAATFREWLRRSLRGIVESVVETPESAGRSGRRLRELGGPLHQATTRGCVYPQLKLRFSNAVR